MFNFILPFDLYIARAIDGLRSLCGSVLTPAMKAITISGNLGAVFVLFALMTLFFKKREKSALQR